MVDDGMLGRRSSRAVPAWMPWALGALGVAALVQIGARVAPDWYRIFGPYLLVDADMVVGAVRAVSPFVFAAAVLVGAQRWPAGRRWLHLGALALGLQGLLGLGSDIWWAIWEPSPGELSDGVQVMFIARSFASAIAVIAASALLAAGLWSARADATLGGGRHRVAMVVIGLVGLVALGSGLWVAAVYFGSPNLGDAILLYAAVGVLVAIGFAATALLALAAAWVKPRRGGMPEVLIAGGATLVAGVAAWEWAFPNLVPLQELPPDVIPWAFTLVSALVTLGFVAMIAGFGAGALARDRHPGADTPPG